MNGIMSGAFELLIFGMGFVFVFLTVLVYATQAMSAVVNKFAPAPVPAKPAAKSAAAPAAQVDPQLTAVIKAAIDMHRSNQKN